MVREGERVWGIVVIFSQELAGERERERVRSPRRKNRRRRSERYEKRENPQRHVYIYGKR